MTTLERNNAVAADAGAWAALVDAGLAWMLGASPCNPLCFAGDGAALLRRWTGGRSPVEPPPTVGVARRPAATLTDRSLAATAGKIHYYRADRLNGGGAVTRGRDVRWVACTAGGVLVAVPNPVTDFDAVETRDGALRLTWWYNPVDQQAEPEYFYIYTDAGTGTISSTYHARVAYRRGNYAYTWTKASGWAGWQWVVLAETAARVKSPTALLRGGVAQDYGLPATAEAAPQQLLGIYTAPRVEASA